MLPDSFYTPIDSESALNLLMRQSHKLSQGTYPDLSDWDEAWWQRQADYREADYGPEWLFLIVLGEDVAWWPEAANLGASIDCGHLLDATDSESPDEVALYTSWLGEYAPTLRD